MSENLCSGKAPLAAEGGGSGGGIESGARSEARLAEASAALDNFREQQLRMENAWLRAQLESARGRWRGDVKQAHRTECGCDLCRLARAA